MKSFEIHEYQRYNLLRTFLRANNLKKSRSEGDITKSASTDKSRPEALKSKSWSSSSQGKKRKIFRWPNS